METTPQPPAIPTSGQPWDRLPGESSKAYSAFLVYLRLDATERSLAAAWRCAKNRQGKRRHANGVWTAWSAKYEWVKRATAHDAYLAAREQADADALWLERRRQMREQDWTQGEQLRRIIDEALPHAHRFIRHQRTIVPATEDQPEREIVTMSFDILALARVLVEASKLQRLATDEPTAHVQLSGAALDAAIAAELARLADRGQAGALVPAPRIVFDARNGTLHN